MKKISYFELKKNLKYKKRIFVITGKNSYKKSGAQKIFSKLLKNKTTFFYYKKSDYPEFKELLKISKIFQNFDPSLLLAIGGGAVMDYAKIVNIFNYEKNLKKKIIDYKYSYTYKKTKLIAIPTTAGSGAEVTSNAVIYIDNKKYSFENKLLIPNEHYLEPKFILNNPVKIKSSSGFDAIAQAMESMFSKKSNKKSINYANKSLNLSIKYFLDYVKRPNLFNSSKMINASNLAGKAINISKTIAPHAVSYPFTARFGISHGHAVAINFEKFLRFNYLKSIDKKKYKIIFKITKTKNINEFCEWIKYIKKEANLEDNYNVLGINIKKEMKSILNGVNILRLKNNPVKLTRESLKKIII